MIAFHVADYILSAHAKLLKYMFSFIFVMCVLAPTATTTLHLYIHIYAKDNIKVNWLVGGTDDDDETRMDVEI